MPVVQYDVDNQICTLTMDRPEALNAFNPEMMHDLCAAFFRATDDVAVKVIVLTGAGRAFTAGADLKAMGNGKPKPGKHDFSDMLNAIVDCPKPLLIAANGLGVGVGMTILGLADLSFVAASSRFKAPFSSLGLTAEAGSTYTFSRLMGPQKASWVLLSAEWFSAAECVEMGLAKQVVPDEQLMEFVYKEAATLAKLPLASLVKTKELMMAPHIEAMKAAFDRENRVLAELLDGPANKEALSAFMEKREADFRDI